MEEAKRSSEKLIELIRSQPNPEEYAEKILMIVENMSIEEAILDKIGTV